MKRTVAVFLLLLLFSAGAAAAADRTVFGPVKYDVKERYGADNRYTETVKTAEGQYVIKLQNGETVRERSDLLQFSVNGQILLPERNYEERFLACFAKLQKRNTTEVLLKDYKPSGFRRPPPTPKNVTMTIMPTSIGLPGVALGLNAWNDLDAYVATLRKIRSPESFSLALDAANLQNDSATRAGAMRKLSELKDRKAQDFILHVFNDYSDQPAVRGEAALALGILGDKASIPFLIRGVLDPQEEIRLGSARALSFYPDEDTKGPLSKALERMDTIMRGAVVRSIVEAGWRPVSTLVGLAESSDPVVANSGVELLTGSKDERVVSLLLAYLDKPEGRSLKLIITALGASKSVRTEVPLMKIAADPAKRKGLEPELATALASLGDPKAEDVIVDMIKRANSQYAYNKMAAAYKTLTGKDYRP